MNLINRPNIAIANQATTIIRSCFFVSLFCVQYLFLRTGDISFPVCLVLSLKALCSGLLFI